MDGLIVSFESSLLESVTVTPPGRAGLVKNTGSAAHSPGANLTPAANEIPEIGLTVTPAVALGTLGAPAVAVIVANPAPTPLTGTLTVVALAWKATDAGTVATPGLLELNETVRPVAGAGDERFKTRFCAPDPLIASDGGEKLSVAPTCTNWLADAYPDADAPMVAEPKLTPVTLGCETGAVAPPGMNTVGGAIVTLFKSLLLKATTTPFSGAGTVRFTGIGRDWLGPTVRLPERLIVPEAAATFVSVKTAGLATPAADAATWYVPASAFAVRVWDLASPDASVTAVFTPPAKVTSGALPEGVNVTVTPLTGLELESRTIADKGRPNGVFTCAVCGVPPVAVIEAAPVPDTPTITVAVASGINGGAAA